MDASISEREFVQWQIYYGLDPWGPERSDLGVGIIASTIANVNRGKDGKPFAPGDFMPKFGEEARTDGKSPEAIRAFFRELKGRHDAR